MNGEVIYFDSERGVGFATGADGNRYVFDRDDLGEQSVSKGAKIEFRADGDRAREIAVRVTARGRPVSTVPAVGPAAGEGASETPASAAAPPAPAASLYGYFRRTLTPNYANFQGRARRKEYWGFVLFSAIGMLLVGIVAFTVGSALGSNEAEEPVWTSLATGLVALALFVPSLAVTVRRQHDIGLSGWFILLWFVPWIGALIIFVFTLIPSQKHDNRWGPVPEGV